MARSYAGILGLLGMIVVLLRAVKDGSGFEGTVPQAVAWMIALALVGAVVGAIAEWTVEESVRYRIEKELETLSKDAASG